MSKPRGKHASGVKKDKIEEVAPQEQEQPTQIMNQAPKADAREDAGATRAMPAKTAVPKVDGANNANSANSANSAESGPHFTEVSYGNKPAASYGAPTGIEAYRRSAYGSGGSGAYAARPDVPEVQGNGDSTFVVADYDAMKKRKRKKGLKAFGIAMAVIVAAVAIVYVAGAVVFMGRFLPGTTLGSHDVSMKTDQEVAQLLNDTVSGYQLDVLGNNGFYYRASGKDLGLSIDSDDIIKAMHADQSAWSWPFLLAKGNHDESDRLTVKFSTEAYQPQLTEVINQHNATATPPVNATIIYNEANDKFVVQDEQMGTQLDPQRVLDSVSAAIVALDNKVQLGNDELVQPTVVSTDPKLKEAADLATGMVSAKLTLIMGGQPVAEVNGDSLSNFITINEKFEVIFKEDEMNAWIEGLAAGLNTVGTERTFTRADGKQVTVPAGGVYGWEVDNDALKEAIIAGVKAGTVGQIEVPCYETAQVYAGPNQRDWGARYIDVDLDEQHVRFYGDNGQIIWESDCISGTPDGEHNTVPGMWYVNNMESPSKLIGYENGRKIYETMVQYWMAFEYNGIGFHDATWQPGFGGSMYANGYGSHGCVNLPYDAAEELYGIVQVGDVVAVHF